MASMETRYKPIKHFTREELTSLMQELEQPKFRAKQLYEWLYLRHVRSYDEMTNLPKQLRTRLQEEHPLTLPVIAERRISLDGTEKYLFRLDDDTLVESVAIPSPDGDRLSVCVSTQVGCAMECAFCATGGQGFTRNLAAGEIVDQVLLAQEACGKRVTNIVFMGQGEPFLNYDATRAALHILNDPQGIAIGARHITVSTCGILSGIGRFSEEPEQFVLAISLHAARQSVRDQLMPRVSNQPLTALKSTLQRYVEEKHRRISLEYLLLAGINDSAADLEALLAFCDGLFCHINFLPMNPVAGSPYQPSPASVVTQWMNACEAAGIEATLRTSRGADIEGACGQLHNSYLNN